MTFFTLAVVSGNPFYCVLLRQNPIIERDLPIALDDVDGMIIEHARQPLIESKLAAVAQYPSSRGPYDYMLDDELIKYIINSEAFDYLNLFDVVYDPIDGDRNRIREVNNKRAVRKARRKAEKKKDWLSRASDDDGSGFSSGEDIPGFEDKTPACGGGYAAGSNEKDRGPDVMTLEERISR